MSCQVGEGSPLRDPVFMSAVAQAAEMGGAVAVRANGPGDIAAIKARVKVPVIGLWKLYVPNFEPYITPTLASAQAIAEAGADLIALDATLRPHPGGTLENLFAEMKTLELPLFADVATVNEGVAGGGGGCGLCLDDVGGLYPLHYKNRRARFCAHPRLGGGCLGSHRRRRTLLDARTRGKSLCARGSRSGDRYGYHQPYGDH